MVGGEVVVGRWVDRCVFFIIIFIKGLGGGGGQTRSRQHDQKCRLKSSQYTLIIPHRVIQLTTISFWVSETRLRLPQVNK